MLPSPTGIFSASTKEAGKYLDESPLERKLMSARLQLKICIFTSKNPSLLPFTFTFFSIANALAPPLLLVHHPQRLYILLYTHKYTLSLSNTLVADYTIPTLHA